MKTILVALGLLIPTSLYSQGPGGFTTNMLWWLKANAGVYMDNGTTLATDGQAVQLWDDQSASNNNAVNATAATRPIYRTALANGYAVLDFDGTQFLDASALSGIGVTDDFFIFIVFKLDTYQTNGLTNDGAGTFIIDRRDVTENLTSLKIVNTDKFFYQRRQDDGSNLGGPVSVTGANTSLYTIVAYFRDRVDGTTSTEGIYINGRLETSQAGPTGNILGPLLKIGRHATNANGGIDGTIAEIAVYNTTLTTSQRQRIESYLALKYGITLDQTTATSYLRASGGTIYSATTFAGYLSDVAGIGQDNNSALTQTSGKSQNANSVVRIHSPTGMANTEFLVWGSNGGSLTSPNSTDVDGTTVQRRLSRVWRVAEPNGNVGTVTLEFDLSAVPGNKVAADLRLMVDANGAFNAGATLHTVTSSSGSLYSFSGVNLADGNYFTIGTVNTSTTPLPVQLVDFNVVYEDPVVVASWKTASETNNDYFTLERATDGFDFEAVGRHPGAGTTSVAQKYLLIDPHPANGKSYYRLRQTDFDGSFTLSKIKHINIERKEEPISVFPNPGDGKSIHVQSGKNVFKLNTIRVIDQRGAIIDEQYFATHEELQTYRMDFREKLKAGLYFLDIHFNSERKLVKLIVTDSF